MIRFLWRAPTHTYHAFLKVGPKLWRSACRRLTRSTAGGPFIDRPDAMLRCGVCDGAEMDHYKADESLPALPASRTRRATLARRR